MGKTTQGKIIRNVKILQQKNFESLLTPLEFCMTLSNSIINKTEDITLSFLTKVVTHTKVFIKLISLDLISEDVSKAVLRHVGIL